MNRSLLASMLWFVALQVQAADLTPVRIADPASGHIHPAVCRGKSGTLVVTYGRVNHRDLRITRSIDGGRTWSPAEPFGPTVNKTYYPGSLTTLNVPPSRDAGSNVQRSPGRSLTWTTPGSAR